MATSKAADHRASLRSLDHWLAYLTEHSGLPGPRANLELVAACAEEADPARATELIDSGDEFATMCGIVALGRHLGAGDETPLGLLHRFAIDDRWRVREAVAMAVQRACDDDPERGFQLADEWSADPDPLVRRAAVAAVCEPKLLRSKHYARRALDLLDRVTDDLVRIPTAERSARPVRTLRQALGYGWSVAIAADPINGLAIFGRWEALPDKDIAWVVRENQKKARFVRAVAARDAQPD